MSAGVGLAVDFAWGEAAAAGSNPHHVAQWPPGAPRWRRWQAVPLDPQAFASAHITEVNQLLYAGCAAHSNVVIPRRPAFWLSVNTHGGF